MYIVIEEENHPDRLTKRVFGPFERDGNAAYFAEGMYQSDDNFNKPYGHRLHNYIVKSLTPVDK